MSSTVLNVTQGAWTDLGTGPLQIQALDFDVYVALGASPPAAGDVGFVLSAGNEMPLLTLQTSGHIYARAVAPSGANLVSGPTS